MRTKDKKVIDLDYFPNKYSEARIIKSLSWFQIFVLEFPNLVNLKCPVSTAGREVSAELFSRFQELLAPRNWCKSTFDYHQI